MLSCLRQNNTSQAPTGLSTGELNWPIRSTDPMLDNAGKYGHLHFTNGLPFTVASVLNFVACERPARNHIL